MKNWKTLILLLIVYVHVTFAAPKELDKIAVIVNDNIILESEINRLLQWVTFNAQQDGQSLPTNHVLYRQIIDRLIINNLQLQIAKKTGITVSNADLDQAITNIAMQNKINLNQLQNHLSYAKMSYNTYRSQIRQEMLIFEVRHNAVRHRVTILPKEVDVLVKQLRTQYGNNTEVNLSYILLALPKNPSQQQVNTAEALAGKLMSKLYHGANFSKLAISYPMHSQLIKKNI